uniref:Uncharacterized protein n=1 Tax=Parastrongyloides trichosuri TaxID=131310 RepID=A0A0N5A212_PARTI
MDDKSKEFISEKFKKANQASPFKRKLMYYLDIKNRSIFGKVGLGITAYILLFNSIVYLWKGKDHPMNNFMWRIQKQNGTLSKEMLEKEKILKEFHLSKFKNDGGKKIWLSGVDE